MFDAAQVESALLRELSLLEVTLLFIRAGYPDFVVHPAEGSASAGDILVRDGSRAVQVVVVPWDCAWLPEQPITFGAQPGQVPSGAEEVRRLIRHAYQAKAGLMNQKPATLVVIRPFLCRHDASLAFDDATLGDGAMHCVETDDETGEVVCRIRRTRGEDSHPAIPTSVNVFAESGIDAGLSAACLYRPPYASPHDALFRLSQNADAIRHAPAEMLGRLAAAHQVAVLESDTAAPGRGEK